MSDDAEQGQKVPTTYERLAAPFNVADHARVNKGGSTQTYAPWTTYVERLNTELQGHWSFRVIREGFTETECWVLGEITAVIDGETVTRQQYGCEPITKGSKPATDLLKTAASDAVKKAASLLGVGLYLSIKEEREAIEAAMREAVAEAARQGRETKKPDPTPRSAAPAAPARPAAASTPAASGAAPSSSSTTAAPAPTEPTPLKTKLELVADLKRGVAYARGLELDPAEPDYGRLNRVQLEDMIAALRSQCRIALAERKKAQAS